VFTVILFHIAIMPSDAKKKREQKKKDAAKARQTTGKKPLQSKTNGDADGDDVDEAISVEGTIHCTYIHKIKI
jgi:hypothetical protein